VRCHGGTRFVTVNYRRLTSFNLTQEQEVANQDVLCDHSAVLLAAMKAQDMYLGVLFSMEDLSVYGYMTNTKIKFIIVLTVPDVIIKDLDMKNVRKKISLVSSIEPACSLTVRTGMNLIATHSLFITKTKQIFRRIHTAYGNHVSNPFYEIDSLKMIKSKKFEQEIESIGRGRALEGGNRNSLTGAPY